MQNAKKAVETPNYVYVLEKQKEKRMKEEEEALEV
jgi:hypothetical protein